MFGTRTSVFVFCVAVLLCATTAGRLDREFYSFDADFIETRAEMPNATLSGKLYYTYYPSNKEYSRLRLDYKVVSKDGPKDISNIYHYENKALYSLCSQCEATKYDLTADPWIFDDNVYRKDKQDGNFFWFYPISATSTSEVEKILMTESIDPNVFKVKQVVFKDKHVFTLDNFHVVEYKKDNNLFNIARHNCKAPTCHVFADIIFVLDFSNSVSAPDWQTACSFVYKMLEGFKLGAEDVAAAVVRFGGKTKNNVLPTGLNQWGQQTCDRDTEYERGHEVAYEPTYVPDGNTADYIAPARWGKELVPLSTNIHDFDGLKNQNNLKPNQFTCQGFGLQLAMDIWDWKDTKNTRPNKGQRRIVIVVTDGYDQCAWTTMDKAEKLKNKYNATLIEVGVTLSQCKDKNGELKDEKYLKQIASHFNGEPYYRFVSNYNEIHSLVDSLIGKVCNEISEDNSGCSDCKSGFCGCGTCYCPTGCDQPPSQCYDNKCNVYNPSEGCKTGDICPGNTGQKCGKSCNYNTGKCEKEPDCSAKAKEFSGTCHEVVCEPNGDGNGCTVKLHNEVCAKQNTPCSQYLCTRDKNARGYQADTGCYKVYDTLEDLQNTLKASGEDVCFDAVCDNKQGAIRKSKCPLPSEDCAETVCRQEGDHHVCDYKLRTDNDPSTYCTSYECTSTGWTLKMEKDEEWCINNPFKDTYDSCKIVRTDGSNKDCCIMEDKPCPLRCQTEEGKEKDKQCRTQATLRSDYSAKKCIRGSCAVKENGYDLDCDFSSVQDCYKEKASDVEKRNQGKAECCNPVCNDGACAIECVPRPSGSHACMEWICEKGNKDGEVNWEWKWVPTEENTSCISSECWSGVCDPVDGCHSEDICTSQANSCYDYQCDDPNSVNGKCIKRSLMKTTTCMHEECNENNQTYWVDDSATACPLSQTYKCLIPQCNYDDVSETSSCSYKPKECVNCDPCLFNTCDNETGEFDKTPKCDDGLFCTEDYCSPDGQCWHTQVKCSEELNMEGYPCFTPRCLEQSDNHTCVRKLIAGAYIDVCGNCISENDVGGSDSSSVDLVSCTNAPPKPVLTEGLAAATIALIVIAAILAGALLTISGVFSAKALIERAGNAKDQVAHTNPLFESNETEMTNPTYDGQTM